MVNDLKQLDLWDDTTAQYLSANDGSLKGFTKYSQSRNNLSAEAVTVDLFGKEVCDNVGNQTKLVVEAGGRSG